MNKVYVIEIQDRHGPNVGIYFAEDILAATEHALDFACKPSRGSTEARYNLSWPATIHGSFETGELRAAKRCRAEAQREINIKHGFGVIDFECIKKRISEERLGSPQGPMEDYSIYGTTDTGEHFHKALGTIVTTSQDLALLLFAHQWALGYGVRGIIDYPDGGWMPVTPEGFNYLCTGEVCPAKGDVKYNCCLIALNRKQGDEWFAEREKRRSECALKD